MSKLFLETLDNKRQKDFIKLSNFKELGILGGGTALALQIGHRKSFDFDIFINDGIQKGLWQKVKNVFGKNSYKTLDTTEQLNLVTESGINITFFKDDYKPLFDPIVNENINLMDIKDVAANKAFIQGRRPKWRDYVDLYFIIKSKHLTLVEIINLAIKKFGSDFTTKLFLEQLVYWDDIYNYEIEFVNKEIKKEEIQEFLKAEVIKLTNSIKTN